MVPAGRNTPCFMSVFTVIKIARNVFAVPYKILLESLFPLSPAEKAVLALVPQEIWKYLPRAPYSSIPESCSLFAYKNELVSEMIWSLKYRKSKHSAKLGGYALWTILNKYANVANPIILVPIPISKQRRRERGFNQCELIIDELCRFDSCEKISKSYKLLTRPKNISRQTLKDRRGRIESANKIFAVNKNILGVLSEQLNSIQAKNYLIFVIDDVVTTGSTMREAVHTLRSAGLTNTYGMALAH